MEDQEKSKAEGNSSQRDQTQSVAETANGTGDVQGNQKEENTSTNTSLTMLQESATTKRALPTDNALDAPPLSAGEVDTNTATPTGATDNNSEPSSKKFKSGDSFDGIPETQATPPTPSASQNSNASTTAATQNSVQHDANYSIATGFATANQPPPTPPPSAASTATNASSIAPPNSPKQSPSSSSFSPRKTSTSSFDTASGWTDDDAYERMPKTPVAPPQSSSSRKAFRHNTMSPLPGSGGVFLPDVPPAPPTTPAAKQTGSIPFQADFGMATPLPYTGGFVQNAKELEQQQRRSEKNLKEQNQQLYDYEQQRQQEIQEGAATPAPPRPQQTTPAKPPARPTTALSDDFSEWAVGDRYKLCRMLGRGSYGEVAQAVDLYEGKPDAYVAIKRIVGPFDQEVDAVRLFREIHILRRLRTLGKNDCIVPLLDVVQPPTDDLNDFHDLYLVFDYVDTDLYKLIMSPQYLTTEHIQTFLYQMLIGLKYIHSGNVIHRDLKPANILLNEDCSLKICDFGLARIVDEISVARDGKSSPKIPASPKKLLGRSCSVSEEILNHDDAAVSKLPLTRQLTKHVVTRWYRAPELILIQPYTTAVDVWSLGCIFAELLSMQEGSVPGYQDRTPLFPGGACYPLSGDTDNAERLDQLNVIFNVIGTPSKEDIANIGSANEYIKNMKPIKPKNLKDIYPAADPNALDLLNMMLKFNPKERCTAGEALNHNFFVGIRKKEMESSVESPMESPAFLNEQEIDIETLKQKAYNEVLWFRDNQSRPTLPPALPTVTQTEEDFRQSTAS